VNWRFELIINDLWKKLAGCVCLATLRRNPPIAPQLLIANKVSDSNMRGSYERTKRIACANIPPQQSPYVSAE